MIMTKSTPCGAGQSVAHRARNAIRMSTFGGEAVAYISISDGNEVMISANRLRTYVALGFSTSVSSDADGKGRKYARVMVPQWGPGRARSALIGRIILAQIGLAREIETGAVFEDSGWVPRHLNGNRLDCRDGNLIAAPVERRRNSSRVVRNVRRRMKLLASGQSPKQAFAQHHKVARQKKLLALIRGDGEATAPANPPMPALASSLKPSWDGDVCR